MVPAWRAYMVAAFTAWGFTKIVGVNNDQLGIGRISETLRQSLRRDRRRESGENQSQQ